MTYTELKALIAVWSKRSDLTALIPGFIQQAEARMGRALRVRQMEAALADSAISSGYEVALPSDFLSLKAVWPTAYPAIVIKPQPLSAVLAQGVRAGSPSMVAVTADALRFDGTGTVTGVYFAAIPALSDSVASNWLLAAHPDAYLFASLAELSTYAQDDRESAIWSARSDQVIREIQQADMRDRFSGALTAKKG
jgi:hypothetical protein